MCVAQLLELLADERAAAQRLDADQAHAAVGEVEHLQRARILDQPHDVIGDELLRADRHVDGERAILVREQLAMSRESPRSGCARCASRPC